MMAFETHYALFIASLSLVRSYCRFKVPNSNKKTTTETWIRQTNQNLYRVSSVFDESGTRTHR
jgi:hypothetical protein